MKKTTVQRAVLALLAAGALSAQGIPGSGLSLGTGNSPLEKTIDNVKNAFQNHIGPSMVVIAIILGGIYWGIGEPNGLKRVFTAIVAGAVVLGVIAMISAYIT